MTKYKPTDDRATGNAENGKIKHKAKNLLESMVKIILKVYENFHIYI